MPSLIIDKIKIYITSSNYLKIAAEGFYNLNNYARNTYFTICLFLIKPTFGNVCLL